MSQIASDAQLAFVGPYVELFSIDCSKLGGPKLYFTANTDIFRDRLFPSRLSWDPNAVAALTSAQIRPVSASGEIITLVAGEHAIIQLPVNQVVNGHVRVNGVAGSGNRIWIIGGSIRNASESAASTSHCLQVHNVDLSFVEGVHLDKANTAGDTTHLTATSQIGGTVYIQNCRMVGINTRDTTLGHAFTQHGDGIQIVNQHRGLSVDKVTIKTWSQGILINSSLDDEFATGPALRDGGLLRRVNVTAYDTALNPITPPDETHPLFYLQDDCAAKPIRWTLDRVYGNDEQALNPSTLLQMVSPGPFYGDTVACGAILEQISNTVSWPAASLISGIVNYGIPPDGDYVPSTFNGLNYQTPGYGPTAEAPAGLVVWQGKTYTPVDMMASGFEYNGRGAMPQPTVRFGNATRLLSTLVLSYGDLIGLPFTRTRTLAQFLDGWPNADPESHFGIERYVIEQKTSHTKRMIEFRLAAAVDQDGAQLPTRKMVRQCTRRYRMHVVGESFDYVNATCPYQGSQYFDENNVATTPAFDRCSKSLTGCKLRFPAPQPLPSWAFPGLARLRI